MSASEDLGDPTDPVTGWDINFKRAKTGTATFNVEYTLNVLRCKKRALSEDELAAVAKAPTIESLVTRPTSADVKSLLEKITKGSTEDEGAPDESAKEAINDLG
jgi:hypothetical protein